MDAAGPLPGNELLFDSAACGLLLTDTNGLIRRVNTTFCRWLGFDAEQLVGKRRVQDLFTMGGRLFHQTHLVPLLQMQGSVAEVQLDMRHADGSAVPMLINVFRRCHGEQTFDELAVFVATDRRKYEHELLLARRKAEDSLQALDQTQQALQASRDVLGIAMRGAKMGAWSRDINRGRVWFSAELEALAGLAEGSFEGSTEAFDRLIHPDDLAAVKACVAEALALVHDGSVEFRLANAGGSWTPMDARVRLVCDAHGKPVSVVGIAIDITERQRDAARLRELNAELALADRKKDEFLATLAHELRNPLAPLRNVLEIFKLKSSSDPQLLRAQQVFERQMRQISHLVDDLMEVSRITEGRVELRRERTDLATTMRGAVEATQTIVSAGHHRLTVALPAMPVLLDADPTRLTQILTNLLNNAAKYTPDGGDIWLSATRDGATVAISVRDSGIGIAAENLGNVFRMFAQLEPAIERAQGGLGIGLALVKGLVTLHGGSIEVVSAGVGKGSEFTVRLPVLAASATPADKPLSPAVADLNATRAKKVLVVDDNHDGAETLCMALEMLGHEVLAKYDGSTALEAGATFQPDVVVLDIGLPDMDGYAVARAMRRQAWGESVLLIAATGWGQPSDRDAATAAGFDAHLVKPVEFATLEALVDTSHVRG
jgi:PAS domain S-box-containing protein